MRRSTTSLLVLLLVPITTFCAHQPLPTEPSPVPPRETQAVSNSAPLARQVGLGLVGGAVGSLAGGFVGGYWAAEQSDARGKDELSAAMIITLGSLAGVALGEPWGVACGVHHGNRRQGDPLLGIAASAALAAAGIGAALAAEDWRILLAVPVFQIGAAVAIERSTARGTPRQTNFCGRPWIGRRPSEGMRR
jgi:hypothetical protein